MYTVYQNHILFVGRNGTLILALNTNELIYGNLQTGCYIETDCSKCTKLHRRCLPKQYAEGHVIVGCSSYTRNREQFLT